MKIADIFFVTAIAAAMLFCGFTLVRGDDKRPKYQEPTAQELVETMRVDVISDFLSIMSRATALAKIEQAQAIPCAKVEVTSETVRGRIYYGIRTDFSGCLNGVTK